MTREAIAKAPSGRTERTPINRRNVLTVKGKDPNYEYRIVNDEGDRIQMFMEAGYEIVPKDSIKVGDKRVNVASSEGSVSHVSVGRGQKAFVMRIKKEWYQEDQAKKLADIKAIEETSRRKALDGTYGSLETTRD